MPAPHSTSADMLSSGDFLDLSQTPAAPSPSHGSSLWGLSRWSVRASMMALLSVLCILLVLMSVTSVMALRDANRALRALAKNDLPAMLSISDSSRLILLAVNRFDAYDAAFGLGNLDAAKKAFAEGEKYLADAKARWAAFEDVVKQDAESPATQALSQKFQHLIGNDVGAAMKSLKAFDLNTYRDKDKVQIIESFARFDAAAQEMAQIRWEQAEASFNGTDAAVAWMQQAIVATLVVALACVAGAMWMFNRRVNAPINELAQHLMLISDGELSIDIPPGTTDEVGQLFVSLNGMQKGLRDIVSLVRDSSGTILTGAHEIAAGNADLSRRTEAQAASLQRTAMGMIQLAGTVQSSAKAAKRARELALTAAKAAQAGGASVNRVADSIHQLAVRSKQMDEVIAVIEGIALQTRILALNAGVEAARAGTEGHGFTVVAREVGQLAQRCAVAAKDVKTLLHQTQEGITSGGQLAQQSSEAISRVSQEVHDVAELISEISAHAVAQETDILQINEAVAEIDGATQQNTAMVEEAAAAAAVLHDHTERLNGTVNRFHLPA